MIFIFTVRGMPSSQIGNIGKGNIDGRNINLFH